ncbi:CopG family transcriptional regulator [Hyperthermus butylicus]|uniref:type II toxin-antitoxin system VapB family antitoxin n=1 Tax=Hyperthermus butylicus TaxID=54248 RepID=UPI0003257F10|nr:CopG family transcriptional regulator [Hyperthermus butylicus]
MSVTVSFRIPRELKERMDRLRGKVNWSEEVRRFLEERVREYEQLEAIRELEETVKIPSTGSSGHSFRVCEGGS